MLLLFPSFPFSPFVSRSVADCLLGENGRSGTEGVLKSDSELLFFILSSRKALDPSVTKQLSPDCKVSFTKKSSASSDHPANGRNACCSRFKSKRKQCPLKQPGHLVLANVRLSIGALFPVEKLNCCRRSWAANFMIQAYECGQSMCSSG